MDLIRGRRGGRGRGGIVFCNICSLHISDLKLTMFVFLHLYIYKSRGLEYNICYSKGKKCAVTITLHPLVQIRIGTVSILKRYITQNTEILRTFIKRKAKRAVCRVEGEITYFFEKHDWVP